MKKLLISLVLLSSILFSSFGFAITEQEANKYLDKDVFIIITHTTSCGLYGRIVDVIYIEEELHIVLDTDYGIKKTMLLRTKDISYIRERKNYE